MIFSKESLAESKILHKSYITTITLLHSNSNAVAWNCSTKGALLEVSQDSHENIRIPFLE